MIRILTIAFAGVLSLPLYAASPADYAWGMPLHIDGSHPVYRIALPEAVYQGSARTDLSDIQVFNSAGKALPHVIQLPETVKQQQNRLDLVFYPVIYEITEELHAGNVQIELDRGGQIRTIISPAGAGETEQEQVYIIDLRSLDIAVQHLVFEHEEEEATFVQPFTLETSDDLTHWRPLIKHAALTRLQHEGQYLEQMRVDLPEQPAGFIRLRWLAKPGLELSNIAAVVTSRAAIRAERERRWVQVNGKPVSDDAQQYLYDLGMVLPVDQLNLVLPGNNTLARASFQSRLLASDGWDPDVQARVYQLRAEGLHLANADIAVSRRLRRYHRVELHNAGELATVPELRAGWIAHELLFLARGEGPFMLAFGRAPDQSATTGASLISADLPEAPDMIGSATAGKRQILGGEARLQPINSINWRVISLWTLLLVAVLALVVMAAQLVRDMKRWHG